MTGRRALAALLAVVAAAAAVLSFSALRDLALVCGFDARLAWLLPVVVDAGAAAGSLVWLGAWSPPGADRYARALALLLLSGSVGGNALGHGLAAYEARPHWLMVVAVSAIAPAVLGALVHLMVLAARAQVAPPEPDEVADAEAAAGVPVLKRWAPGPTSLYRLLDDSGALLYVGITGTHLAFRLASHRRRQPWWGEVAETTVEEYETRIDALAAEREAIASEGPRYNKAPGALVDHCTSRYYPDRASAVDAELLARARDLMPIGRPTLAKELGITTHMARRVLEALATEDDVSIAAAIAGRTNGHQAAPA